ncbi:MAG: hypothetical protein ACK4F9_01485 [Brevinematia bacterium]
MFIKNIVIGILGFVLFPVSYFILSNLNFLLWGIITSSVLILFYFVNVYVIGKTRSFLTTVASWLVLISLCIPISTIILGSPKIILLYTGIISISISWLMILIQIIISETFKGY